MISKLEIDHDTRDKCYKCFRPKTSCMCRYVNKIDTNTKFVILMHPREFKKTKNGTGHFTHLSLENSAIYIGIDFSNHKEINSLIDNPKHNCFILYPGVDTIKLNTNNIKEENKTNVIFIIDSTWACSKKILRVSRNLHNIPRVSFEHTKSSAFKIKTQPNSYCLSTMESTLCILELLDYHNIENIEKIKFQKFLLPFEKMVDYQFNCAINAGDETVRYKKPYKRL
ncbi:MAG: tRNA-uridine aminocarboxypropyltransferase [Campylobacterota bacterium]|nr:tRNA-uridine aminocarboxypropyltransferase [Campylobacterota bacterium]